MLASTKFEYSAPMDIGKVNEFKVISAASNGHWVRLTQVGDRTQRHENIFMPHLRDKEKSESLQIGDIIEAFVYKNDEGKVEATQQLPYAEVDEFVVLKVVNEREFGVFMDWGMDKDLLVPIQFQQEPMQMDEYYLIRICLNEQTGKFHGTSKFAEILADQEIYFEEGDQVEVIPAEEHHLGFRCIVNRHYLGLIYSNEIFTEIDLDLAYDGYVKKIREDGLIDVSLQKIGSYRINDSQDVIMKALKENGGALELHDKSSPASIKAKLGMSKQTFKNSIGRLYKARKITISKTGIKLV